MSKYDLNGHKDFVETGEPAGECCPKCACTSSMRYRRSSGRDLYVCDDCMCEFTLDDLDPRPMPSAHELNAMMTPADPTSPPSGWFVFGTHVEDADRGIRLTFSDELGEDLMPLWETHDSTTCCPRHGHHVSPHRRCILR